MNESKIAALLAEIDAEVPREGAAVVLRQYGGGPDESEVLANRRGYLRLGIEFMKGALVVPGSTSEPHPAPVDIKYLISEESDVCFQSFTVAESTVTQRSVPSRVGSWVILLVLGIVFLGTIGLAIVGFVSLFR